MPYQQVSFLPWVQFKDCIQLGPITLWSYDREADERIKNQDIRKHLDRYFESYVNHDGEPVNAITICSYDGVDFNALSDDEYDTLRNAIDVIVFSSILSIVT